MIILDLQMKLFLPPTSKQINGVISHFTEIAFQSQLQHYKYLRKRRGRQIRFSGRKVHDYKMQELLAELKP